MEISIHLSDWENQKVVKDAVDKAIMDYIEPEITRRIKDAINTDAVANLVIKRIQECFEYSCYNDERNINSLSGMIQERVEEIAKRITDDELKNFLLQRFFKNITRT